ncbi:phosphonoacetaldehyde hydrolase [Rhodopseudomonas palustris]|uniref:Phosphonoacetaldehyde hydrolase n=1 Tax=Thiospirillum jenense TaxID=1653858 RepID=A0A839HCA8_9GAMM|nr:phosphonoacetaldehyde hydrolase [Rhodopseudomonas palustris]MBB1124837.1 phosphonoacetaldehyde hydrolase [Thiospirillum jenense]
MSDPFEGRPFPRAVLIGAAVLISFVIAVAAFVRVTGIGRATLELAPQVTMRELRFEDIAEAKKRIYADKVVVAEVSEVSAPFIFGVLRAMQRQRKLLQVPFESPYLLSLRADGQLILEDPSVGERIDLRAFGPDNTKAFSALLTMPPLSPTSTSP